MQYRAILVSIDGLRSRVPRTEASSADSQSGTERWCERSYHGGAGICQKGLFGQRIKAFESRVASFKRSPEVPQNWAEVEDAFDKVKLSYDRLQNAYTEVIIMEHDPDLETQNKTLQDTAMEECSGEFLKAAPLKNIHH